MCEEFLENEILDKKLIADYNLVECATISNLLMKKYHRLSNSCLEEPSLRITSRYEPIYNCSSSIRNTTNNIIDKHLDDIRDYNFMNEKIVALMGIMSRDEKTCFTEKFLHNKTDYSVAKIMGRSICGIQPFVNSCIVRIVLAFHLEVLKNETRNIDDTQEIELIY